MVKENPTCGAPRIHGELLNVGWELSERTVSGYLARVPRTGDAGERWKTFLKNHRFWMSAVSMRFTSMARWVNSSWSLGLTSFRSLASNR